MANRLTVSQLERLLNRQRAKLEGLEQQRHNLQKRLALVETRIASVGGAAPEGRRRRTRMRPKNTQTLMQAVAGVLAHSKKGLTLKELAQKVLANGYKTTSDNFANTVYQIIYNNSDKVLHDAKTKTYRLK